MTRRVPALVRTRESLSDLIEGLLSSADGCVQPVGDVRWLVWTLEACPA